MLLLSHYRWVTQLEEEFFRQGDVERQNGMAISPLFDRSKQGITKSQVGFFDIVIIPLFHTFGKVFSNSRPLLTYVMRNYRYWSGAWHPSTVCCTAAYLEFLICMPAATAGSWSVCLVNTSCTSLHSMRCLCRTSAGASTVSHARNSQQHSVLPLLMLQTCKLRRHRLRL